MFIPCDTAKVVVVGGGAWLLLSLALLALFGSTFKVMSMPRPPWYFWMALAVLCFFCLAITARLINKGDFYSPQKQTANSR
jgi:hypothetical protein